MRQSIALLSIIGLAACGDDLQRQPTNNEQQPPIVDATPPKMEPMKPYHMTPKGIKEVPTKLSLDGLTEINPGTLGGLVAFAGPDRIGVAFSRLDGFGQPSQPGTFFQVFDGQGNMVTAAGILPQGNVGPTRLTGSSKGFGVLVSERDEAGFGKRPIITLDPNGQPLADIEIKYAFMQDLVERDQMFYATEGVVTYQEYQSPEVNTVACRIESFNENGGVTKKWPLTTSVKGILALGRAGVVRNNVPICGMTILRSDDTRELTLFIGEKQVDLVSRYSKTVYESGFGFAVWVENIFLTEEGVAVYWTDARSINGDPRFQSYLTMVSEQGIEGITYPLDGVMDLVQTEDGYAAAVKDEKQRLRVKLFDTKMLPLAHAETIIPTYAYFTDVNLATNGGRIALQWSEGNINGWRLRMAILNRH